MVDQEKNYLTVDDFFRTAKTTTIAVDVRNQISQERERDIVDKSTLRQQADWSLLADKIVGAEGT